MVLVVKMEQLQAAESLHLPRVKAECPTVEQPGTAEGDAVSRQVPPVVPKDIP